MLKLKEINLGKTDAKNELLSETPQEVTRFLNSFVVPPALNIDAYLTRDKYFVTGLKGTGKTALLRYISLRMQEEEETNSQFVLFKSEIDEDLRKDFSKAARTQLTEDNASEFDGSDYETVWRWFIYRKIASAPDKFENKLPFQSNANLATFVEIVNSEKSNMSERSGIMKLIPKIRRGNIEISKSPKLGLDFDWNPDGIATVNFNALVRRADEAFERLQPSEYSLRIFFDELELNYSDSKQHKRDAKLIRDLIVSISRINATCKKNGYGLCIYAAIRSEVLTAVDSLGKEINKPLTDFGTGIMWNRPGLDASQQPLLNIIEQRINNARTSTGLNALASAELWSEYFPKTINNQIPQVYILHNSWYRPRDIVRLLISVQEQHPNETSFVLQGLEAVRKAYSTASWVELTEEMKATYKPEDISAIKRIFYGFRQISNFADFSQRAEGVSEKHQDLADLIKRKRLSVIAEDLYRIGIIGNIDARRKNVRFSFRGDDEIMFDHNIFVHNALKPYLSISQ